jgi:HK97 family phage major capsid protein
MNKDQEQILNTVKELRSEVEKAMPDKAKLEEMHKALDTLESSNQKSVAAQLEQEKKNLETEESLKSLEAQLARRVETSGNKKGYRESDEFKALNAFVVGGESGLHSLDQQVKSALRTDIDAQGGFLVPEEMDNVIIKKITEISAIRSIARVRTTAAKTMNMPIRSMIPEADYEGEAQRSKDGTSKYESETITPYRLTFTTPITLDMLMDAAFNMESELLSDAAEAFAFKEGKKFVDGSGSKQPHGFLSDSRVLSNMITSSASNEIRADDILKVTGELKTGYNPTFVMNRRTLALLRTEKSSTDGHFIWQPAINGAVSATIAGERYLLADQMPDVKAGAAAVAYGDFLRGYTIIDRTGMSVIRDEYTAKREGIVEFTFNKYNTGRVTLPEALTGIITKS